MSRITEKDVALAAKRYKELRQAAGKETWYSVEYYNGWCHLHEVDADKEARHCAIRHVTGGTKREIYEHLHAASAGVS